MTCSTARATVRICTGCSERPEEADNCPGGGGEGRAGEASQVTSGSAGETTQVSQVGSQVGRGAGRCEGVEKCLGGDGQFWGTGEGMWGAALADDIDKGRPCEGAGHVCQTPWTFILQERGASQVEWLFLAWMWEGELPV